MLRRNRIYQNHSHGETEANPRNNSTLNRNPNDILKFTKRPNSLVIFFKKQLTCSTGEQLLGDIFNAIQDITETDNLKITMYWSWPEIDCRMSELSIQKRSSYKC